MSDHVLVDLQDGCLSLRLNRPDKKNSLTRAMYATLAEAMQRAETDPAVRVVLLSGTQDCFCAGNDIADFIAAIEHKNSDRAAGAFLFAINALSKPIVAAVNGPAVGIGTTMLLHCDFIVAGRSAKLQMPFTSLGVCAEGASSLLVPARLGYARAAQLLMLGDAVDAQTAERIGLINAVHDDDRYQAEAMALVQRLLAMPQPSLRETKKLLKAATADLIPQVFEREFAAFTALLNGPEAREALTAFTEKRRPDFKQFG